MREAIARFNTLVNNRLMPSGFSLDDTLGENL